MDGLHSQDLSNFIAQEPGSTLASLVQSGVVYPNAYLPGGQLQSLMQTEWGCCALQGVCQSVAGMRMYGARWKLPEVQLGTLMAKPLHMPVLPMLAWLYIVTRAMV